jgi:CheY-like chemotaxis protein
MNQTTVLLVDDDVDFIAQNRRALEAAGYRVVEAHDGDEGFKIAQATPPDVIIVDVMMRTANEGFELARRIRREERLAKIPLFMLTSINEASRQKGFPVHFSDADRDETWLPVDRFIDKPIAADKLVAMVRQLSP